MKKYTALTGFFISKIVTYAYFQKIVVTGKENIPAEGPVLFLSNHRNGIVDGFVLHATIGKARIIINKELTKFFFIRFFFSGSMGIDRYPDSIAAQRENLVQLKRAAELIRRGDRILMFPEGTSNLGPSLLPVHIGASHLIAQAAKAAAPSDLYVVPIGLHYSRGYEFRSDVEIYFGKAWKIRPDEYRHSHGIKASVDLLLRRVSVNFADKAEQRLGELFADMAIQISPHLSHRAVCIRYTEGRIPQALLCEISRIAGSSAHPRPPVVLQPPVVGQLFILMLLTPLVAAGFALNIIPLAGAYWIARAVADDNNVISLWRIIAGVPLLILQVIAYAMLSVILFSGLSIPVLSAYFIISLSGLKTYRAWKDRVRQVFTLCSSHGKDAATLNNKARAWIENML